MTPSVLYITRTGMLEPLGQSQVLAYLKILASDFRITLVSFEKPADLADGDAVAAVRRECAAYGIVWLPQTFHHRPRLLASAWDMATLFKVTWREVRRGHAGLIHARSYAPAAVAMIAGRLTGTPFVFDMRALWPEELITAGRLARGSLLHRLIAWAEGACIRRAAATVSLTHAAAEHLESVYGKRPPGRAFVVIPTCADLDRFTPGVCPDPGAPLRIGCIGTVLSGWFQLDWLISFYRAVARLDPAARFEVVTRDDPAAVRRALEAGGVPREQTEVFALPPARMPNAIRRQSASVMFYATAVSELGRSPTRMGEILGCGVPVVANSGVGDVAGIIRRHNVGILVEDGGEAAMDAAARALMVLLADPDLPRRCRQAAEEHFSLERGAGVYAEIYRTTVLKAAKSSLNHV